jgi:hypothetical protein
MTLLTRLRVWYRRWRRKRAARQRRGALREFAYLDEVSVYSLYASRIGPIAAEFTETQTASLQSEIGGSLSAGGGLAQGQVASNLGFRQQYGSQVLRKAVIQTTFKELYDLEVTSLVISPMPQEQEPPKHSGLGDLLRSDQRSSGDGWVLDSSVLIRGQLAEVEVQLEAEPLYRVAEVVAVFLEMVEENADIFPSQVQEQLSEARAISRILKTLMVGLVPVRGLVTDYEVIDYDGHEKIVHKRALDEVEELGLAIGRRPLYIVGVAEQALFWKDIRRVLFADARFRLLCRVARDGLQESWTPVKLAHVLESVVPGVSKQLDIEGTSLLASMARRARQPHERVGHRQELMEEALVTYAHLLANHCDQQISADLLARVESLVRKHGASMGSVEERRKAFRAIRELLSREVGIPHDPLVRAKLREAALQEAGLDLSGQPTEVAATMDLPSVSSEARFLDSEIVAIYW